MFQGASILMLYDVIRIFRRIVPHGVWAIAAEDLLYWIATAFLIFRMLYRQNDGALRGYALFAVAAGMLLYHQSVSGWLVDHISGVCDWLFDILLRPFRAVYRKVVQVVRMAARFYKKKLKNRLKEFIMILFS